MIQKFSFEETEIKALFPDSEFFRLSQIESDNKK